MKETRAFYLTKSESQVMNVLWSAKKPLTQQQIVEQAGEDRVFKERSIFLLLNHLMERKLIQEVGFVRSGKTYARTFKPVKSRAEWYAHEVYSNLDDSEIKEFRRALRELLSGSEA